MSNVNIKRAVENTVVEISPPAAASSIASQEDGGALLSAGYQSDMEPATPGFFASAEGDGRYVWAVGLPWAASGPSAIRSFAYDWRSLDVLLICAPALDTAQELAP